MVKALALVSGFFALGLTFQNCAKLSTQDDKSSWQKTEILAALNPGYYIESDGNEDYSQKIFKIDFQQNKIYGKDHEVSTSSYVSNREAFNTLTTELSCDVLAEIQAFNTALNKANLCRYHGVFVMKEGEEMMAMPLVLPPTYYQTIFRKDGSEVDKGRSVNNCFKGPCEHHYDYETVCHEDFELYRNEKHALSTKVFAECF